MPVQDALVAIYARHADSKDAVRALQVAGFNMARVSLVAKDHELNSHRRVIGFREGGGRIPFGRSQPPFWAELWNLLPWSAFFWIPETGALFVGGPLLVGIVEAGDGEDTAPRRSALGLGLHHLGIPRDRIARYETAVKVNQDLVIAQGTEEEVILARPIIRASGSVQISYHRGRVQSQPVNA
jgi:hypothetical protein